MSDEPNFKIDIKALLDDVDGKIIIETDIMGSVHQRVLRTEEQLIRDGLMRLGWLPPVNPMSTAPRDGTRILLHYKELHYGRPTRDQVAHLSGERRRMAMSFPDWYEDGDKWEDCRWIDDPQMLGGSAPYWEPWAGNPRVRNSGHVSDDRCLGWLPLPRD